MWRNENVSSCLCSHYTNVTFAPPPNPTLSKREGIKTPWQPGVLHTLFLLITSTNLSSAAFSVTKKQLSSDVDSAPSIWLTGLSSATAADVIRWWSSFRLALERTLSPTFQCLTAVNLSDFHECTASLPEPLHLIWRRSYLSEHNSSSPRTTHLCNKKKLLEKLSILTLPRLASAL